MIAFFERFLQDTCKNNALSCKILLGILQEYYKESTFLNKGLLPILCLIPHKNNVFLSLSTDNM